MASDHLSAGPPRRMPGVRVTGAQLALAVVVAALLITSAVIHLARAGDYTGNIVSAGTWANSWLSEAFIFRAQAVVGVGLAVLLLAPTRYRRPLFVLAGLFLLSSLVAVLTYRYATVGVIGPLPDMTEPTWTPTSKPVSAVVEGAGGFVAFIGYALSARQAEVASG